jgi:hypothetical protein
LLCPGSLRSRRHWSQTLLQAGPAMPHGAAAWAAAGAAAAEALAEKREPPLALLRGAERLPS